MIFLFWKTYLLLDKDKILGKKSQGEKKITPVTTFIVCSSLGLEFFERRIQNKFKYSLLV